MPKGGYVRTPEIRAKISASLRISQNRPEVRAKISASKMGKKATPETRARISASNLIAMNRPEVKSKISASQLIAMNRPEVKAKLSASQLIAQNRPEVKAKLSGENNGSWIDGHTIKDTEWRVAVKEKDNYICQECGKKCIDKKSAHTHHIYNKNKYPELQYIVELGVCLCSVCHPKLHTGDLDIVIPASMIVESQRIYNMCVRI